MSVELAPLIDSSSICTETKEPVSDASEDKDSCLVDIDNVHSLSEAIKESSPLDQATKPRRPVVGVLALVGVFLTPAWIWQSTTTSSATDKIESSPPPTIAFCGNSFLYYNDCPRLVETMLAHLYVSSDRLQDSCIRGGSNLASLWEDGNGMQSRFESSPAAVIDGIDKNGTSIIYYDIGAPSVESLLQNPPPGGGAWDVFVLQDDASFPTQPATRQASLTALREHYLPAIVAANITEPTTVLFLQGFPPNSPKLRERTAHLGDFDEYTGLIVEGNEAYATLCRDEFGLDCRLVPMGRAMQAMLYAESTNNVNDEALLEFLQSHLYNWDDFHPSPHATWLQSCLVVTMATGRAPPVWDKSLRADWQRRARFWQSAAGHHDPLPLPTAQAAEVLRQLACRLVLSTDVAEKQQEGSAHDACQGLGRGHGSQ